MERSKLEAELRQCAEVDRPNAVKAFAQCGKDRAALEAKLAKVVAALKKNAAGGGSKKKSSRRRRRRSKKSSSLIEVEQSVSEDEEDDEQDDDEEDASSFIQMERSGSEEEMQAILSDTSELDLSSFSEAELHMQKRQLWGFVERLKAKAQELMDEVQGVDKRIADTNAKLGAQDAKQKKLLKEAGVQQKKEEATQKDLEKLEQKSQGLVGKLSAEDAKLEAAQKKVTDAMNSEEKAGADLAKEQAAETASLLQLASLVQEEHRVLHASLEQSHRNLTSKLRSNEVALSAIMSKENEEECDAVRADVIKAQSALEVTGTALKACLMAKKEIQAKIDHAVELGKKAEAGLANCLKTKKVLKSKIAMCHERRDAAREKLKACLDRKKVLKVQIEKCHEKRDEARKKLAECLARKKELKEKIAKATQGGMQKRSSLVQEEADLEAEATEALKALHKGNMELNSALDDLLDAGVEEQSHIHEMQSESKAGDEALTKCEQEDAAEADAQAGGANSLEDLKTALSDLSSAGKDLEGAANANAANAKEVGLLEQKVAALLRGILLEFSMHCLNLLGLGLLPSSTFCNLPFDLPLGS